MSQNDSELARHVSKAVDLGRNKISLLPTSVVDQIAAGEVVDRPAHLIKELVENSVDAGASMVEVEYDHGGRFVRVTDNGSGIGRDELPLALARHATSKIREADDLWRLGTFGFRGEALASIAAVSRLTLTSRTLSSDSASQIRCEFGRVLHVEHAAGNLGTTILIEELFANVPARLKFLKSEASESTQIKQTLRALAISHPHVELRVKSQGRILHLWSATDSWVSRCEQVLEQNAMYVAELGADSGRTIDGHAVKIAFASPHDVAKTSKSIWIFVQGRWVQDRGLQASVQDAYRGLLMHGEFPVCVVMLTVPTEDVDVNIHPTKSAVKFRDSSAAFRSVHRCLRAGLESAPWLSVDKLSAQMQAPAVTSVKSAVHEASVKYAANSGNSGKSVGSRPLAAAVQGSYGLHDASLGSGENPFVRTVLKTKSMDLQNPVATVTENSSIKKDSNAVVSGQVTSETEKGHYWSQMQVIGQVHQTYIVAQRNQELILIDQHAAHERVAFEKLMRQWKMGCFETQSLLIPLTLQLSAEQIEALQTHAKELQNLGLEIDQAGPQTLAIRSYPALMKESAVASVVEKLALDVLDRGGSFAIEKKIADIFATMACHSVVRAGQALSIDEMRSLLQQMDEFPLSSFCPHGRPVSVTWTQNEIEREFGRIN